MIALQMTVIKEEKLGDFEKKVTTKTLPFNTGLNVVLSF